MAIPETKLFPLHSTGRMIPWSVAERAYEVYSKRYGTGQSLERLAQRGGFGACELDDMIPGWREEVEEIFILRKEVERLQALVEHQGDGSCDKCGSVPTTKINLCSCCLEVL